MGGAETWLMSVLRLWSENGDGQMDFLLTGGEPGVFDQEAKHLGAKLHYVRFGRRDLLSFVRSFRRILREGRYDAIHDHADYASGWHFLMGVGALPPVCVTHVHTSYDAVINYGATFSRRMTAEIGKSLVASYSTHITATSWQMIADYGFDSDRFRRIPKAALHCGFDPARFLGETAAQGASIRQEFGWPEDAIVVLFVGRMDESAEVGHPTNQKNSGFAVTVGIECARRDPRIRLLLIGAPTAGVPALKQRVAEAGLSDHICFAGIRKDISRFMIGSDVLVFPSQGEGLGMVAVEAQAAGLPVLASTAVPRECVVAAELVRFQDIAAGEATWAEELLELAAMPRNQSSGNQRVAASAFAIDRSSKALLHLYRDGVLE